MVVGFNLGLDFDHQTIRAEQGSDLEDKALWGSFWGSSGIYFDSSGLIWVKAGHEVLDLGHSGLIRTRTWVIGLFRTQIWVIGCLPNLYLGRGGHGGHRDTDRAHLSSWEAIVGHHTQDTLKVVVEAHREGV